MNYQSTIHEEIRNDEARQEKVVIIIEQGSIVSFRQYMEYPSLEGVNGEGI